MVGRCTEVAADLSAFLDEQLEPVKVEHVSAHLAECEQCRKQFESLKAVDRLVSSTSNMPVPDLWEAISGKLPGTCEVIQEDLSAYLDGELPLAAQEGVNEHLKGCEPCRHQFKRLNATNHLIAKGLELPAALKVDLWAGVKARLNEDCALILSELSVYVDQEVATLRHRAITAHLLDCPPCQHRFNELSRVGDFVRAHYQPRLSEDFDLWPEIKSKLQVVPLVAREKAKPRLALAHRMAVAAVAVVVVLTGTLVSMMMMNNAVRVHPVSAETYLLESAMMEPAESAEAVVYDGQ